MNSSVPLVDMNWGRKIEVVSRYFDWCEEKYISFKIPSQIIQILKIVKELISDPANTTQTQNLSIRHLAGEVFSSAVPLVELGTIDAKLTTAQNRKITRLLKSISSLLQSNPPELIKSWLNRPTSPEPETIVNSKLNIGTPGSSVSQAEQQKLHEGCENNPAVISEDGCPISLMLEPTPAPSISTMTLHKVHTYALTAKLFSPRQNSLGCSSENQQIDESARAVAPKINIFKTFNRINSQFK